MATVWQHSVVISQNIDICGEFFCFLGRFEMYMGVFCHGGWFLVTAPSRLCAVPLGYPYSYQSQQRIKQNIYLVYFFTEKQGFFIDILKLFVLYN